MKSKEMVLLLFVGVCAILVAATVATALGEAEQASSGTGEQLFSVSIAATSDPALDAFEFTEEPFIFNEGDPEPTPEPDPPAQFDEGADEPTPAQGN